MANFLELFTTFILAGLMIFGIFALIITVQSDNHVTDKFSNNPLINQSYYNLEGQLTSFRNESQTQKSVFETEDPTAQSGGLVLFSIVSSGKLFNGMMIALFNIFVKLPIVFLGVDPLIIGVLATILIVTIIITLWAIYKIGA